VKIAIKSTPVQLSQCVKRYGPKTKFKGSQRKYVLNMSKIETRIIANAKINPGLLKYFMGSQSYN
jgi:hypothetical protein